MIATLDPTPIQAPTPATDAGLTWRGAFRDLSREHALEPLRVEGRIPEDLSGALFRAGPSLFSAFGDGYGHWFDGDGALSEVRFGGGQAQGAVRVVQSAGLAEERGRGRRLYGGYGTPTRRRLSELGGLRKNPANTLLEAGWRFVRWPTAWHTAAP